MLGQPAGLYMCAGVDAGTLARLNYSLVLFCVLIFTSSCGLALRCKCFVCKGVDMTDSCCGMPCNFGFIRQN